MKEIKNRLIYRLHDAALNKYARKYLSGKLVDIGCGTKPYADLVRPYINEHIGVDHELTQHDKSRIDVFGTAYDIPVQPSTFDSAMCTAVLEHLEEPERAINECFRVLKPGGYAIYTAPFIWHLHEEPRDFFRYSKYGLKHLFEKAGFEIAELEPLSGFWVTFGQLFVYYLYRFNRGPLRWFGVVAAIGLIIQLLAFFLDRLDRAEIWTWMYLIVVRKRDLETSTASK